MSESPIPPWLLRMFTDVSTARALAPTSTAPPLSLEPLFEAADRIGDSGAIRLFVNSYAKLINNARFAGQEPTESDAVACDKIVDVVLLT